MPAIPALACAGVRACVQAGKRAGGQALQAQQGHNRTRVMAANVVAMTRCEARPSTTPMPPTDATSGPTLIPAAQQRVGAASSKRGTRNAVCRGCCQARTLRTSNAVMPLPLRLRSGAVMYAVLRCMSPTIGVKRGGDCSRQDQRAEHAAERAQQEHEPIVLRVPASAVARHGVVIVQSGALTSIRKGRLGQCLSERRRRRRWQTAADWPSVRLSVWQEAGRAGLRWFVALQPLRLTHLTGCLQPPRRAAGA
jgi:hypothetical protein